MKSSIYLALFSLLLGSFNSWSHEKILQVKSIGHSMSAEGLELFNKISLTFDDGPHPVYTKEILNILDLYSDALEKSGKQRIKATFFINGKQVANYNYHLPGKYAFELLNLIENKKDIVRDIVDRGHILANHSVSHASLTSTFLDTSPEIMQHEINLTHQAVEELMPDLKDCSQKWFFRAPFGGWRSQNATDGNQDEEITKKYVGPVFWDIGGRVTYFDSSNTIPSDAADWECASLKLSAEFCARGYLNRTFRKSIIEQKEIKIRGGIVLMHDIQGITPKLLTLSLRVWTGLNPFAENSNEYLELEKFVKDYKFDKIDPVDIISLNQIQSFNQFDERFTSGHCK